jgi:hypothetical protein
MGQIAPMHKIYLADVQIAADKAVSQSLNDDMLPSKFWKITEFFIF